MREIPGPAIRDLPKRDRRGFVRTSAAAAVVAASTRAFSRTTWAARKTIGTLPKGRVLGANDRINVAYIGVGKQGRTHVKIGKDNATAFNIQPVAVSDVYDKHLHMAQKELGLSDAMSVRDYRRLLDRHDIDAVVVATVDNWHADVAIDAMDAGKHVYGEKPMARYLEEGFRLYDTCKRTGRVFQIGSQYLMDEKVHKAAEWIRDGRIGPLVWAQGGYCRNNKNNSEWTFPIDADATPENLDWKTWLGKAPKIPFSPERYFSWHKYYAYNSGILGNLLSHTFLPLLLASAETGFPKRVTCTGTRAVSTDREITDTTHVLAEMPSGLTFCIVGSTVNEQGFAPMIRGQKGTIYLPLSDNKTSMAPERPYAEEIDAIEFSDPHTPGSVSRLEKDFYDCIRGGGRTKGHIELALQAHVILSLAEMSERTGRTLHYDPKTRAVRDADGRKLVPLDYKSKIAAPAMLPLKKI
ncbi:MAG: Gfo/Idh/MocA family oxidoreductase [Deltaproteobacteria bacterium]|nr:Gfo/Idh/MocA family oxidoreductase [Deltaproteobacteria bacterium]